MSDAKRAAVDAMAFRAALGHFCTGVTVVSAGGDGDVRAMTATAFSSVSLDPPMILVCIGKQARIGNVIRDSGRFAISILSDRQEEISRYFGRPSNGDPLFEFEPWEDLPVVADALTHLAATVQSIVEAGDHDIFLANVTAARSEAGRPLIHFKGRYQT